MDLNKLKITTFIVGAIGIIFSGLMFVLLTDIILANSSNWLFLSILSAFGAGATCIVAETVKHNKTAFYVLKGIAILCGCLFIVVVVLYDQFFDLDAILDIKIELTRPKLALSICTIVSLVLGIPSVIGLVLNLFVNYKTGIEE